MDARRLGWAVREGPVTWCGEATVVASGHVNRGDAGHGGDVDDATWVVGCSFLKQQGLEADGRVED